MTIAPVYTCDECGKLIAKQNVVDVELTFGYDYQILKQFCCMKHVREWLAKIPDDQ